MEDGIRYKAQNRVNGKVYIGQTVRSLKQRMKEHCWDSETYFDRAIDKHGIENFEVKIIDRASTQSELNDKEVFWIAFFDSTDKRKGYNLSLGGSNGMKGFTHSPETREKMRKSHLGKKHTEEQNQKMREILKGRVFSEEHRRKIRESKKGKVWFTHTPESIERIREVNRTRVISDETRAKMSKAHTGQNTGEKHFRSKKVVCVETGITYPCILEAARQIGKSEIGIRDCCHGRQKTCGGYHWEFIE